MKTSLLSILAGMAIAPPASVRGFISFNQANPEISKHAVAQKSELLKIHLDIAQEVTKKNRGNLLSGNRLGIEGLTIELRGEEEAGYKHPNLPGANGPNPQLSSGAKTLELLRKGKFVDLTGTKQAELENGAWEIIWRNNAKAGSLVCGFDVPEPIKRNGAIVPKGRVYITFPVWTEETLTYLRARKMKAEEKATEALDRVKHANVALAKSSNPLQKAMAFRDAMKAHEDLEYSGYNLYNRMPLERDMIELSGGLHLCSVGTVWTKKDGFFADHILLGSASALPGEREEAEKKLVTERELKSVAFDGLRPESMGL